MTLLLIVSVFPTTAPAAEAETSVQGTKATQVYVVRSASEQVQNADIPDIIEVDGKEYHLRNVDYEVVGDYHRAVTLTRSVTLHRDAADLPTQITLESDGFVCQLTAAMPTLEWQTLTQEYSSDNIPETLEEDGVLYRLTDVSTGKKKSHFEAPAKFVTSGISNTTYAFNNKTVTVAADAPVWDGYEQDVAQYLGLNGSSYRITGGRWDGDWAYAAEYGGYVRHAIYSGYRDTPVYTAAYEQEECSAELTYTDTEFPDGYYTVRITATYRQIEPVVVTVLKVGGAIVVAALATAGIIVLLKRRRKESEEETTTI